jgi:ligand-binding SRPBCC domain-containing protein
VSVIKLFTVINAPVAVCFNLARSIDAHKHSTKQTREKAVAGKTSGLAELNDTITWQATHFGVKQKLTVKITELEFPVYFKDVMLKGAFKTMEHIHEFEQQGDKVTLMKDVFSYTVPFGIIGNAFDSLILRNYMTGFLKRRNEVLKHMAEHEESSKFL